MIPTLLVTLLIEGIVVLAYSTLRRKPAGSLQFASFTVNVFTQVILWLALGVFFRYYLIALLTAEGLIWLVESLLMLRFSKGQLNLKSAVVLSFCMNSASFGLGWFLPV